VQTENLKKKDKKRKNGRNKRSSFRPFHIYSLFKMCRTIGILDGVMPARFFLDADAVQRLVCSNSICSL